MIMSDLWRMSTGLRRASAVVAGVALAFGGAKVTSDHTVPGSGFSTLQTAAADPTGPTGGPGGGPGGMNGSQFQPPGLPPQMPDYQGGINQPPLDQNSGISIYNTGSPGAQQVPSRQGAQQSQQGQQPAHGTQIPDYQTATPYTQGPGTENPDYQAPQQNSPQQDHQQNNAPTQTQQPSQKDQQDRELQQQCQQQAQYYGLAEQMASFIASAMGGAGSLFGQPSRQWGPAFECSCAPEQGGPHKQSPGDDETSQPCVPTDGIPKRIVGADYTYNLATQQLSWLGTFPGLMPFSGTVSVAPGASVFIPGNAQWTSATLTICQAPSEGPSGRNPAQDKLLTKGDIKKLEDAGFDVHELKGGKNASKFDLYKDREGNIYVKPKGGRGEGDPLGININDI